jgi:hypothetical protein
MASEWLGNGRHGLLSTDADAADHEDDQRDETPCSLRNHRRLLSERVCVSDA